MDQRSEISKGSHKVEGLTPHRQSRLALAKAARHAIEIGRKDGFKDNERKLLVTEEDLMKELVQLVPDPTYLDPHNAPEIPISDAEWRSQLHMIDTVYHEALAQRLHLARKTGKVERSSTRNGYFLSNTDKIVLDETTLTDKETIDVKKEKPRFWSKYKHRGVGYHRTFYTGESDYELYATLHVDNSDDMVKRISLTNDGEQEEIRSILSTMVADPNLEDLLVKGINEIQINLRTKIPHLCLIRGTNSFVFIGEGNKFVFTRKHSTGHDSELEEKKYSFKEIGDMCVGLAHIIR